MTYVQGRPVPPRSVRVGAPHFLWRRRLDDPGCHATPGAESLNDPPLNQHQGWHGCEPSRFYAARSQWWRFLETAISAAEDARVLSSGLMLEAHHAECRFETEFNELCRAVSRCDHAMHNDWPLAPPVRNVLRVGAHIEETRQEAVRLRRDAMSFMDKMNCLVEFAYFLSERAFAPLGSEEWPGTVNYYDETASLVEYHRAAMLLGEWVHEAYARRHERRVAALGRPGGEREHWSARSGGEAGDEVANPEAFPGLGLGPAPSSGPGRARRRRGRRADGYGHPESVRGLFSSLLQFLFFSNAGRHLSSYFPSRHTTVMSACERSGQWQARTGTLRRGRRSGEKWAGCGPNPPSCPSPPSLISFSPYSSLFRLFCASCAFSGLCLFVADEEYLR